MNIIKTRLRRKTAPGIFDAVHLETSSGLVIRPDGGTVESRLQEIGAELDRKVIDLGAINQDQFDNLNYSHTMVASIGPWVTGHPPGHENDYGIITMSAYIADLNLPNGMQDITYTGGARYYRKAVNGTVTQWFKIPTDVDMRAKANIFETVHYTGNALANPETTGFQTLAEYIKDKFHHGFRGIYGSISNFEELHVKQWGYGIIALPGEGGDVWNVEIFRSLANERYFRQLNANSGGWITDKWDKYLITSDIAGKANADEVMAHGAESLTNYTTVLELASSVAVDTSVFSLAGTALCDAADSPIPGTEMHYLILMDYGPRRTVLAINYANNTTEHQMFVRKIWSGAWKQSKWVEFTTSMPSQEHTLPLAEGWLENTTSTYFRNQSNEVNINFKVHLSTSISSGLAAGLHTIATLPIGYRPYNPKYFMCAEADWSGDIFAGWVLNNGSVNVSVPTTIPPKELVGFAGSVPPFTAYDINTIQSQVRIPTTKMTLDNIPEEPINKCMCIVDADGNYIEFVMVTISYDEIGTLYTVHYYNIRDGERLIDCQVPPTNGTFIHPVWDDITSSWVEHASNI